MSKPTAREKPKKKPRRVVLGVGHPWFMKAGGSTWTHLCMDNGLAGAGRQVLVPLEFDDLGNYNRIRLVAEVLK